MAGAVNHAVSAAANLLYQHILSKAASGQGVDASGGPQTLDQQGKAEDGSAAGQQQPEEHQKCGPQDIESLECLVNRLLCGYPMP